MGSRSCLPDSTSGKSSSRDERGRRERETRKTSDGGKPGKKWQLATPSAIPWQNCHLLSRSPSTIPSRNCRLLSLPRALTVSLFLDNSGQNCRLLSLVRAQYLLIDNYWQNLHLLYPFRSRAFSLSREFLAELSSALSGYRSLVFSFDNYRQNCHLLSLAHALAIALFLRSLWSVLDCTRFLFLRSHAFFFSVSLLTYL